MKKIISIFLAACFVSVVFTGCNSNKADKANYLVNNSKYSITQEDGKNYMTFKEAFGLSVVASGMLQTNTVYLPTFSSIAELKEKIRTGEIPERDLVDFVRRSGADFVLEIGDVENLYDAILPEGVTLEYVCWDGDVYSFIFTFEHGFGKIEFMSPEKYFGEKLPRCTEIQLADGGYVEFEQYHEDRNAVAYGYRSGSVIGTQVLYEIQGSDGPNYVRELYKGTIMISEGHVPGIIEVCGEADGAYYYVWLMHEENVPNLVRPSVEWLSSFGLTPYVEE